MHGCHDCGEFSPRAASPKLWVAPFIENIMPRSRAWWLAAHHYRAAFSITPWLGRRRGESRGRFMSVAVVGSYADADSLARTKFKT